MARPDHGFNRIAKMAAQWTGRPIAFALAAGSIALWIVLGPVFHYSDTWQLVINTATTIVTFLMVFLIQNSQNRDTGAIQIKLDELIRSVDGAHTALLDLEELDEDEIESLRREYENLAEKARSTLRKGRTESPPIRRG